MKRAILLLALLPAFLGTSCSVFKFGKKDDADANPYAYEDSGNGGYSAGNFYGDQTSAPGYSGQYGESANVVPFSDNGSGGSSSGGGSSSTAGNAYASSGYDDAYTPPARPTAKPAAKKSPSRTVASKSGVSKTVASKTVAKKVGRTSATVAARSTGSTKAKSAASKTYVVKPGDNLYRISLAKNVSVKRIKQLNGLSSDTIRSGQRLVLN